MTFLAVRSVASNEVVTRTLMSAQSNSRSSGSVGTARHVDNPSGDLEMPAPVMGACFSNAARCLFRVQERKAISVITWIVDRRHRQPDGAPSARAGGRKM